MRYVFDPQSGLTVYRGHEVVAKLTWELYENIVAYCRGKIDHKFESRESNIIDFVFYNDHYFWCDDPNAQSLPRRDWVDYLYRSKIDYVEISFATDEDIEDNRIVVNLEDENGKRKIKFPIKRQMVHQYPNGITVKELIAELQKLDQNKTIEILTTADLGRLERCGRIHDIFVCGYSAYLYSDEPF